MLVSALLALFVQEPIRPVRVETITPIRNATFNKSGKAQKRVQGGNPRTAGSVLMFDGSMDGNRQVDPQVAVGGGYVLHGTNSGIVIYDKKGNYVDGVPQKEFNDGIDPKMFYDHHNRYFCFDLWVYWDKEKVKPVNISASETADPRGAWNTYPVPAPNGVDGGGIGFSRKWIGYSFPGGEERNFVLKAADVKKGKPAKVWHFKGSIGHPVNTTDSLADLLFVDLTDKDIIISRVAEDENGDPMVTSQTRKPHGFKYFGWPPASPMKGTDKKTASGDRNPKNLQLIGGHIYFSQAVNINGRAGVQFNKFALDGTRVQTGWLSHPTNSYIETTMAVNKSGDVLVGFQETGPDMSISARAGLFSRNDPTWLNPKIFKFAEGIAPTEGGAWGDYSGTVVDGDNLNDFWTIQSYANDKGRGSTIIAKVPPKS
ncbi:MAG: hypothetical protein QE269_02130 [Fimbriimonas sp.]|nr:hypothetical protein [Fimbriimonas sp.]